jgi:tetratricopeptide (TPR) repeat protein
MKPKKKQVQRRKARLAKQRTQFSPTKIRFFTTAAFLFFILLLLILELTLRLTQYGGESKLFIPTPDEKSEYYGINRQVSRRYFLQDDFWPTPRKDLFLRKKSENSYRIFVLGGSTTAGFPYGHNVSFPRILQRRLSDTFSDRRIEVVNTAMTAINSYTLLDFMDEILQQQPDALLIYAGHNEFYGALGVGSVESLGKHRSIVLTYLGMQRFKTFQLLRNGVHAIRHAFNKSPEPETVFDPMKTQMARIVKEKEIPLNHDLYRLGEKQFKANLRAILRKAQKAGIPVLISELVSNVHDQMPFVSVKSDTLPDAVSIFRKAKKLEQAGEYNQARTLYYRAKDLDALRFRATESFNRVIHEAAREYNCPVVPMKSRFESESQNGLIGNNLMHEHLHPNYNGYFVMADAFYQAMRQNQWIEVEWPSERVRPSIYYYKNWGFTRLDSTFAALTITHLKGGWPFEKTGPNRALDLFRPHTREDSLCLRILRTGESTLEQAHIELANYYETKGDIQRALAEYRSLIYTVPYLDLFYEPTIQLLISHEKYEWALQVLTEGFKYNKSPFMLKWIGQLSLIMGETRLGILYLEKARKDIPDDVQLLYNLARGYYHLRQFEDGDKAADHLKELVPDAQANTMLIEFRRSILEKK